MLPNMAPYLKRFEQEIIKRTKAISTIDFVETVVNTDTVINAAVQVADQETIQKNNLDFSKIYIMVHTSSNLDIGNFLVWQGQEHKIVRRNYYIQYGYNEVVAEEVKA